MLPLVPPPQRLIVEAEDLQARGAWKAKPWEEGYFCASFANTFISRQAFLGAPADCPLSEATGTIVVPKTGPYLLFARYACPYMHETAFTVQIKQGGRLVGKHIFGRLQAVKIWPFGGGFQPMPTYSWGGGDNIVWEKGNQPLSLQAGPAQISLLAGPQHPPAAERQIDVLLLAPQEDAEVAQRLQRWSYLPLDGLLTHAGELFLRINNPPSGRGPFIIRLTTIEHSPYWIHQRPWRTPLVIGRAGVIPGNPKPEDALAPGQSTPWIEIGSRLDRLNESTLLVQMAYSGQASGCDVVLEFAVRDKMNKPRILRRLPYADATTQLIRVAIPGNLRSPLGIRTAEEDLERLLAYVRSLPQFGRTPSLIGIRGVFASHFTGTDTSARVRKLAEQIRRELIGEAGEAGYQVTSLGDEIHLQRAKPDEALNAAFRQWLQARGEKPAGLQTDLGQNMDPWAGVKLNYDCRETNPRLWFLSQLFGYEYGSLRELKEKTEKITRESGGAMRTGANYSPHPYYWPVEYQWIRPFKLGALTMPWTEDYVWGIPELSPQVVGYLMDVFRCAAKYHDLPIVCYVMPHMPGNTPRSFRLSYYEALAHGAKLLDHFCVTPVVTAYTENYVRIEDLAMYREIHHLARELGQFEEILYYGHVRPAKMAMLISGVTDIWNPSVNFNQERKAVYYALRHAGFPVDFVTEEDIAQGALANYRLLYISASHFLADAVPALTEWIRSGGIAVSSAGGGLLDEAGQINASMLSLWGLQAASLSEHDAIPDFKQTLPFLRPVEGVRLQLPGAPPVHFPAYGLVQKLEPTEEAQIVGQFHDGSPAAVLHRLGHGQTLLIGALPGIAYVAPALPRRPWDRQTRDEGFNHFLPTDFDAAVQQALLWAVQQANVKSDIQLSAPLVEWNAIDSERGTAIMLINWTGRPLSRLKVTGRGALGKAEIFSVQQGRLQPQAGPGEWTVELPLVLTDCLILRPAAAP